MNFDSKLFGSRLKEAVLKECGLSVAVHRLQAGGLDKITPPRLSEYFSGTKVPTLERFAQMVYILNLDVGVVFPAWTGKPQVKAIRHPSELKENKPVPPDPSGFANGKFLSDADVWPHNR